MEDLSRTGSDRSLVLRLRGGDAAAFDAVYQQFHARILSFLYRLTKQRDLAEDLFQEVWLRFARHASGLRDDTQLAAWLFTVARNLYRSHLRWAFLKRAREESLQFELELQETPEQQATSRAEIELLSRAIAALPARDREVLLLIGTTGLTQAEVADVLGLSPEAMRKRLSRARAELARTMLEIESHRGGAVHRIAAIGKEVK